MAFQRTGSRFGSSFLSAILYGLLLVAGFELYHLISARAPRRSDLAHQHALLLIDLERRLGLLLEPGAQRAVIGSGTPLALFLRHTLSTIYAGGQIPWLAAMLSWVYLFGRPFFRPLCLVVIAASVTGILFAGMYPVAPPRFALAIPPYGLQDVTGVPGSERALVLSAGFNPFASLPSMHVLWACLTGFGLWLGAPPKAPRWAALVFPLIVTVAVVLTGNHYVVDCLASFLLTGAFIVTFRLVSRGDRAAVSPSPTQAVDMSLVPWPTLLRRPALLAGLIGLLLACDNTGWGRMTGITVLLGACGAVAFAGRLPSGSRRPATQAALCDWYAGLLLVAGATTAITGDGYARVAASILWVVAAALPFGGRLQLPSVWSWLWAGRAPRVPHLDAQRV